MARIFKLTELEASQAVAETAAQLTELRGESETLKGALAELRNALLHASDRKPEELLEQIGRAELRLRAIEVQCARIEGVRLEAEATVAFHKIPPLQDAVERAFERQAETAEALEVAAKAAKAAEESVYLAQHDLRSAENALTIAENNVANHRQAALAALQTV